MYYILCFFYVFFFFFFKQKTAYEISVRDWSSDVCSSDLSSWHWASRCTSRGGASPRRRRNARPPSRPLPSGVVAEQRDHRALRRQRRQCGAHRRVFGPRLHVEIEEILPRRGAVGAALQLGEVEPRIGEWGERPRQRSGAVR